MSWDQSGDAIQFSCETGECMNSFTARVTFAEAWASAKQNGWVSFKRSGRNWTYHCPACADQAERDHEAHKRNEAERERIKARNG